MKLLSATIRNYRVHENLTVDFDPRLTLITGPNESGKSTLAEAIHRSLFLRFKTGGEVQKGMISNRGGHPEVELKFEAGGKQAALKKVFKGPTGICALSIAGQPDATGDAAEEILANLLKTGGKTKGGGKLEERWAHLWVWQGTSGNDPAGSVAGQQEDLIRRLQQSGGNALILSALDDRIAREIRNKEDTLFTTGGTPRAGTEWHRANQDAAKLQTEFDRRQEAVTALTEAAESYRQAVSTIEQKNKNLMAIHTDLDEARVKLETAENLDRKLPPLQRDLAGHEQNIASLEQVAIDLAKARDEKTVAARELDAGRVALSPLKDKAEKVNADARTAAEAVTDARRACDLAQKKVNALAYHITALEKKERLVELETEANHIEARRKDLARIQQELDALPTITDDDVEELETLKSELDAAEARLSALGARIKVISTGETITVDGKVFAKDEEAVITSPAKVDIGTKTKLLISPGGHEDLDSAREEAVESRKNLADGLTAKGVTDIPDARKALIARENLDQQKSNIEKDLKRLKPVENARQIGEINREHQEAERSAGLAATDAGMVLPSSLTAAKTARKEADTELKKQQANVTAAEQRKETLDDGKQSADEALQEMDAGIKDLEIRLAKAEMQIALMEKQQGSDEERAGRLMNLKATRDTVAASIKNLKSQINAFQPELQKKSIERLGRAEAQLRDAITYAERDKISSETQLKLSGSIDPNAELAQAKIDLENGTSRCRELEQQAKSIQLLARIADSIQKEAAQQFTRPLAEATGRYLQCLFGADTTASLAWNQEERAFEGLQVSRPGAGFSTFPFSALSGGAREQVGVALRLAMAEVLAADHDGCLPVVLDDAFANSDPIRVKALQAMLDLAANNGLQIIVLTCNPSDYSTLGAKEIQLTRPILPGVGIRPTAAPAGEPEAAEIDPRNLRGLGRDRHRKDRPADRQGDWL